MLRPAVFAATNTQPTSSRTSIPATDDILTIGVFWQDTWVRNFNPFSYQQIFYPTNCIYELLMVFNPEDR